MTTGTEQAVSDALLAIAARVDGEQPPGMPGKGTGSRAHILAKLESSTSEFTIDELAAIVGLHPNTVRAHLDVLVAGGRVERIQGRPHGRGRPPLAFKASADARAPYDELSRVLSESLEVANAPELARRTAERWAQSLEPQPIATTADQAVDHAVESLHSVGFSAEASPLRDSITIGACPFAELVEEHPIICAIHTELLSTVLSASGQEVGVEAMDVWVMPALCRARLSRPDQTPARTIDPQAYGDHLRPPLRRPAAATEAPDPPHAAAPSE